MKGRTGGTSTLPASFSLFRSHAEGSRQGKQRYLLDWGTQLSALTTCRKEAVLETKQSASHRLRIPSHRVGDTDHGIIYAEPSVNYISQSDHVQLALHNCLLWLSPTETLHQAGPRLRVVTVLASSSQEADSQ